MIAATVRNMLLINLGLIMTMPTICIAALTGMSNEHNRNEFLTVSAEQASWVGELIFVRFLGKSSQIFAEIPSKTLIQRYKLIKNRFQSNFAQGASDYFFNQLGA